MLFPYGSGGPAGEAERKVKNVCLRLEPALHVGRHTTLSPLVAVDHEPLQPEVAPRRRRKALNAGAYRIETFERCSTPADVPVVQVATSTPS